MRIVIYIVILAALFFVPLERVDVAKLLPIKAVSVYMDADEVVFETDTEHKGKGKDVTQAIINLKKNTPAVVYLDTAQLLMVSEDALPEIDALRSHMKPAVKLYIGDARQNVKDAAKYLEVHGSLPKLKDWDFS